MCAFFYEGANTCRHVPALPALVKDSSPADDVHDEVLFDEEALLSPGLWAVVVSEEKLIADEFPAGVGVVLQCLK